MRTPIEIGEEYRRKLLPKCWEDTEGMLRRRSRKRAVLAWLLVVGVAVALGLARGML